MPTVLAVILGILAFAVTAGGLHFTVMQATDRRIDIRAKALDSSVEQRVARIEAKLDNGITGAINGQGKRISILATEIAEMRGELRGGAR